MSYKIEWIIPNRILYLYSYGHSTVTDGEQMMQDAFNLVESSNKSLNYLVHNIIDARHVTQNDMGVNDIRRIFSEQKGRATHPGWTVIITPSPIMRFFGSIALQFMGMRGRQVASVEESMKILIGSDDNLPTYTELMALYEKVYGQIQLEVSESQQ